MDSAHPYVCERENSFSPVDECANSNAPGLFTLPSTPYVPEKEEWE